MTITIEQLKKVTRVVYHANCADGFASAMICSAAFNFLRDLEQSRPVIEFIPINYGFDLENLEIKPGTLFVDMCPSAKNANDWIAADPIVLDHHISAKPIVEKFVNGVFGENDKGYSGAMLAFENVMEPVFKHRDEDFKVRNLELPEVMTEWNRFAELCMIYDTWKTDREEWEWLEACRLTTGLVTLGLDKLFQDLSWFNIEKTVEKAMLVGTPIFDEKVRQAESFADSCLKFQIGHLNCAFINTFGAPVSMTGETLRKKYQTDIAVFGYLTPSKTDPTKMEWLLSFRGSDKFNVSKLGKKMGGGGHAGAAGGSYSETPSISNLSNVSIKSSSVSTLLEVVEHLVLSIINEV